MTERRIAIVIDADGKAGVAAFDATTGAAVGLTEAMEDLDAQAKKSGDQADKTGKRWEDMGKKVGLVVAAAVTGFALLVGHQIKVADEAGKLAAKVGVSTEFISEMGFAAKATGADTKILESGLFSLGETAVKAEAGVKRPAAAFKALGVDVTDAHGKIKSLEVLLPELANKFERMQDGPKEAALATVLFGGAAKDLLPLLNEGAAGIDEFRRKCRELGLTVTEEAAKSASEFNDQLDLLKDRTSAVAQQVAAGLTPALGRLAAQANVAADDVDGLRQAGEGLGTLLEFLVGAAGRVSITFQHLGVDAAGALEAMRAVGDIQKQISTYGLADGTLGEAWDRLQASGTTADQMHAEIEARAASARRRAAAQAEFDAFQRNLKYVQYDGPLLEGGDKPFDPDTSDVFNTAGDAAAKERARALERQREAQQKYREELQLLQAEIAGPLKVAEVERDQRIDKLDADLAKHNITQETHTGLVAAARQEYEKTRRELQARQDILGQIREDYETEIRLAGLANEQRRVEEELIRRVNDARKAGLSNADIEARQDAWRTEIEISERAIAAAQEQVRYAEDVQNAWIGAATSATRAFGDFFANGLRGGKDFVRSLKDIFKSLVSDMVTMFLDNSLVKPFQSWLQSAFSGAGGGGIGGNQQGGLMAGFGNIINTGFDKLLSGMGSLFGFGGQAATGIETAVQAGMQGAQAGVTTGASQAGMFGGMGGSFASAIPVIGWIMAGMQANADLYAKGWEVKGQETDILKAAAKGSMLGVPGFGLGAVGGIAGVLMVDKLLQGIGLDGKWASILSGSSIMAKLFGHKKPEVTGQGITGSYGFDGFSGQSYADILQKGGWFRSDKRSTQYGALDTGIDQAFDAAAAAVNAAAVKLASQAGIDISQQLAGVRINIGKLQLSTNAEEAKAQIEAALNQMIEGLSAKAIDALGFSQLLDDGYKSSEIMTALSVAIRLVTGTSDDLGRALTALEIEKVALGVEYFERMAEISGSSLAEEIQRIVGVIDEYSTLMSGVRRDIVTHDLNDYQRAQLDVELQYRSLIDQANELAKAMGLSGARAEDLAAIEQWRALQMADLAEQYQQMVEDQRDSFLASLGLSDLSPLRDDQKLLEAMQLLQDAASSGDWDAAQKYAQQVLGLGRNLYASGEDYTSLYNQVLEILNGMAIDTDQQAGLDTLELQRIADLLEGQPDAIAQALFNLLIAQTPEPEVPSSGGSGSTGTDGGTGGGGSTGGGGGSGGSDTPSCVAFDMFLDGGQRAIDTRQGDIHATHDPGEGFSRAVLRVRGEAVLQPCVRLVTTSGAALVCSRSTPFTAPCAPADTAEFTTLAPDMRGRAVYVMRPHGLGFSWSIESVVDVQDVGDREVIPLDFGGRSFPAGEQRHALIYSHNMMKSGTESYLMAAGVADQMVASLQVIAETNAAMAAAEQSRTITELASGTRTGR